MLPVPLPYLLVLGAEALPAVKGLQLLPKSF
jgi:hypothetical protein